MTSPDTLSRTRTERGETAAEPTARRRELTPPAAPTPRASRQLQPAVFVTILVVADLVGLAGGYLLTFWLRFHSGWFPTPLGVPAFGVYAGALALVLPLGLAIFRREGLYRTHRATALSRDLVDLPWATGILCVILVAIAFFYRGFSFSRTVVIGFWLCSSVGLLVLRRVAAVAHRSLHRRGFGVEAVAVLGGGAIAAELAAKIRGRPGSGLRVVATLAGEDWRPEGEEGALAARARRLGHVRSLVRGRGVRRFIVTDPELSTDERFDLVEECHALGVQCDFVPDLFEVMMGRARVEEIDGVPLVGVKLFPLNRGDRIKKRTLDLVVTLVALVAGLPLLGLIAAAVRIDSRGPALYRQRRLGRDGREFDMLKFRSMPPDAEEGTGPVQTRRGDDRATRLGRLLRRTSLDELPQLWNVLRGEMSLVGPRPERQFFVEQYRGRIPRYLERHGVKSGITGWAQVNGLRGDTSIAERTRYDIWYLENWSLGLDLRILFLTLVRFLFQKEAR